MYSNARAQALKELYKSKELDKTRPESIEADFEEVAASCGHFSFNLQDFADEMQNYLAILEELKEEVERPKHRSWKWLMFWRKSKRQSKGDAINNEEQEQLIASDVGTQLPKDIPDPLRNRLGYRKVEIAAKVNPESKGGIIRRKAMRMVRFLDRDDSEYFRIIFLTCFLPTSSTICDKGWSWSCSLCSFCFHTRNKTNVSTISRRMGTFVLHVGM